jgi:hypothetical protein
MILLPNTIPMGSQPCLVLTSSQPLSFGTKHKGRGAYYNWFTPKLWLLIVATMKHHKNHTLALKYLCGLYRIKGDLMGPYDKLSRGTLNKCFTSNGEVRVHVQACAARQQAFVPQAQHIG